jgi:predicted nucleic acid-binding protein
MKKLTVLAISTQISRLAVDLVRQYCLSHKLKLPDAQIAATAIFYNAELFTLNRRDFAYISDLKLYDHISG